MTASGDIAIEVNDELFDALRSWRLQRAQTDGVAPFMIAHNTTLVALAATPPHTPGQLIGTPGFGPKKAEAYGTDILAITAKYAT